MYVAWLSGCSRKTKGLKSVAKAGEMERGGKEDSVAAINLSCNLS